MQERAESSIKRPRGALPLYAWVGLGCVLVSFISVALSVFYSQAEAAFALNLFVWAICFVYHRRCSVMAVTLVFMFPYLWIAVFFVFQGVPVSPWPAYQFTENFALLFALNSLFLSGMIIGFGPRYFVASGWRAINLPFFKSRFAFWTFQLLCILSAVFGLSGDSLLDAEVYGSGSVRRSALFEYFLVFFAISAATHTRTSTPQNFSLIFVGGFYCAKALSYGGRIEVAQFLLLVALLYFRLDRWRWPFILICALLAGVMFVLFEDIRHGSSVYESLGQFRIQLLASDRPISNQFGDVVQASVRVLGLINEGYISLADRLSSVIFVVFAFFLPSSMLPETYNLSTFRQDVAASGGGGLVSAFSYAWLGLLGPLLFGLVAGKALRTIFSSSFPLSLFGILVFCTLPRWFAYYPVSFFRICLLAFLIASMLEFLKCSSPGRNIKSGD